MKQLRLSKNYKVRNKERNMLERINPTTTQAWFVLKKHHEDEIDAAASNLAGAATAAVYTIGTAANVALSTVNTGVTALNTTQQDIIATKSGDGGTGAGAAIDGDNAALNAASNGTGNLGGDYRHLVVATDGTLIDPAGLVLAGTADRGTLVNIDGNGTLIGTVDTPVLKSTDVPGNDTGLSSDTIITAMKGDGEGRGDISTLTSALSQTNDAATNASAGLDSAGLSATNLTSSLTGTDQALNNLGTSIADLNFDVDSLDQALGDGAKIGSIITDAQGSFVELTQGMDNGTRVIQTGDGTLSDASILQSGVELVSNIASASSATNAALLTAYAIADSTEARTRALTSIAPNLTNEIINIVDTVIDGARLIGGAIYDSVTTGIDAFINNFSSLNQGLSPLGGGGGRIADFFVSANADGGPVMRNSPYIVGENGPELFVPKTNGTVISNTQVKQFQESNNNQLLEKIDKLIEAVYLSSNDNAKQVIQGIKPNNPTWNPTAFGRV